MNSLSWLLYLADVADSVKTLSILAFIFTILAVIIGVVITQISKSDCHDYRGRMENQALYDQISSFQKKMVKPVVFIFVITSIVMTFVPSSNTIYLIAASQAGEEMTKTPEFAKVRAVIDKWLDDHK